MRTRGGHRHELDGTEAEGQMNGEGGYQKENGKRNTGQKNKSAQENGDAAKQLGQDSEPGHEMRRRDTESVENGGEGIRSTRKLGEAMLDETKADEQAQREKSPASGG